MECYMYLLTVSSEKASKLLRLLLFFLQRHHNSLPFLCMWLREQKELRQADPKILTKKGLNTARKDNAPLLQCTHHMCPVRVHWHVKVKYKDYWRVKIAITNFNYKMNHTLWTLAVQHPNLNNVTQVFSFDYKSVAPYGSINDTGMFYGTKFYNDLLMEAGPSGNVQSEV
ncbi:hypothetical protein YC2023_119769 [Brassica napus]|uniref:COBRA C-terminal domain-containing protein n=1 Tax=Brassica oleracea var. oleracea TaxID=109376 RepID=A0A0D3EF90_BRAOL